MLDDESHRFIIKEYYLPFWGEAHMLKMNNITVFIDMFIILNNLFSIREQNNNIISH